MDSDSGGTMADNDASAIVYGEYSSRPDNSTMLEWLRNPDLNRISKLPPVRPETGQLYLFQYHGKWNGCKSLWRCDQYNWRHKGSYPTKAGVKIFNFSIITTECPNGNEGFKKVEYIDPTVESDGYVFVFYQGDSSLAEPIKHGLSKKKTTAFVRNAPIVGPKVLCKSKANQAPKEIYDNLVAENAPPSMEPVTKPRNTEQVRNFLKDEKRKNSLGKDALINAYQISRHLQNTVHSFNLIPHLTCRILSDDMLSKFEDAVTAGGSKVQVFYDTTFTMGAFYVSPLIFRCTAFTGDPIVPLGYLVHEKKWKMDHQDFFRFVKQKTRNLFGKPENVVFITDREFDLSEEFPQTMHLYCWNHLMTDLERWLDNYRSRKASKDQKDEYISQFKRLLKCESFQEYQDLFEQLSVAWDESFLAYYKKHLEKTVISHTGRWVVEPLGLYNPYSGITSNCAESFNCVMKEWVKWKEMPLDCLILSLYYLFEYYIREIERGFYQLGTFTLKDMFKNAARPPHQCPARKILKRDEILAFVKSELQEPNMDDVDGNIENVQKDLLTLAPKARARELVVSNKISWVQERRCFVVEGGTSGCHAVHVSSPMKCSCPARVSCYHIAGVRMLLGKDPMESKPRVVSLQLAHNWHMQRRKPGRKQPARDDHDKTVLPAANSILARSATANEVPIEKSRVHFLDETVEQKIDGSMLKPRDSSTPRKVHPLAYANDGSPPVSVVIPEVASPKFDCTSNGEKRCLADDGVCNEDQLNHSMGSVTSSHQAKSTAKRPRLEKWCCGKQLKSGSVQCSEKRCQKWYHIACVDVPKEALDETDEPWFCSNCSQLPALPAWGGSSSNVTMQNSCSIDNAVVLIYLQILQQPGLIGHFGTKTADNVLAKVIEHFKAGRMNDGKFEWVRFLLSQKGVTVDNGSVDLFGGEIERVFRFFRHIYKMSADSLCDNNNCQQQAIKRHFWLPVINEGESIQAMFSCAQGGICGVPFKGRKGKCTGSRSYSKREFVNDQAWFIPLDCSHCSTSFVLDAPETVQISGITFKFGGVTMHDEARSHFSLIFVWRGRKYYYDGMKRSKMVRPLENMTLHGLRPNIAAYFRVIA